MSKTPRAVSESRQSSTEEVAHELFQNIEQFTKQVPHHENQKMGIQNPGSRILIELCCWWPAEVSDVGDPKSENGANLNPLFRLPLQTQLARDTLEKLKSSKESTYRTQQSREQHIWSKCHLSTFGKSFVYRSKMIRKWGSWWLGLEELLFGFW